jgi:DNA (cytosine-5)-methyltransferase 1
MNAPVILELCAGEGGSTRGLMDAGWDVIAVDDDANRLKRNPARWRVQSDAFIILDSLLVNGGLWVYEDGERIGHQVRPVATWAGWPCQGYSAGTRALRAAGGTSKHKRLIAAGREAQRATGLPYVIENVEGARSELIDPIMLCGRQFGLTARDDDGTLLHLDRHRYFESDVFLLAPIHEAHDRTVQVAGVYGGARKDKDEARTVRRGGYVPPSADVQSALLGGVDWMSLKGRQLCIPPVYAQYVGTQLLDALERAA